MLKDFIFRMRSPSRDDFRIPAFRFGSGEKSVAIVGSMRGDEVQQQFVCSQIVKRLLELEGEDKLAKGHEILIVPCANHFSMNLEKRFWAMDNTDINRMFPGYAEGETTQRIAAALFERVKDYAYGIQLASYYVPGDFTPHVRMMKTGYQDPHEAMLFGLPYVFVRDVRPFDTVVLNYNWQVFGTKAFSLYAGQTGSIDRESAQVSIESVMRFLSRKGFISLRVGDRGTSKLIGEGDQISIHATSAGLFYPYKKANSQVKKGELLARIIHPYDGSVLEEIKAPTDASLFFLHNKPLVLERTILLRLIR